MPTDAGQVTPSWRWVFTIELPICLATAGYWLLAPGHYVDSAYGVASLDVAHVGLLRQLAFVLLSILVWFYGRWLVSGRVELRPFRFLQEGLALGDVLIIVGAIAAALGAQLEAGLALAQIVPAGLWLTIRVVFLVRTRARGR